MTHPRGNQQEPDVVCDDAQVVESHARAVYPKPVQEGPHETLELQGALAATPSHELPRRGPDLFVVVDLSGQLESVDLRQISLS